MDYLYAIVELLLNVRESIYFLLFLYCFKTSLVSFIVLREQSLRFHLSLQHVILHQLRNDIQTYINSKQLLNSNKQLWVNRIYVGIFSLSIKESTFSGLWMYFAFFLSSSHSAAIRIEVIPSSIILSNNFLLLILWCSNWRDVT